MDSIDGHWIGWHPWSPGEGIIIVDVSDEVSCALTMANRLKHWVMLTGDEMTAYPGFQDVLLLTICSRFAR